jgi:F0F1-type ATP synthase membrane subunit a
MKTKGFKKFLRELLFRPFNIILMPLLVIAHFYSWLITDDKEWNEPSR